MVASRNKPVGRCGFPPTAPGLAYTARQGPIHSRFAGGIRGVPTLMAMLCLAIAVGGCNMNGSSTEGGIDLPYYGDASFTPRWFPARSAIPEDFHSIGSFTLQNQDGNTVTDRDLDGKLYVANFFFTTCPGICPATMSNMKRLQGEFAEDDEVVLLSHTVTPERDSVGCAADLCRANTGYATQMAYGHRSA